VQTGFCRTGSWAAYEQHGVVPDLSTWAKSMGGGLPIGAVLGRADVMDAARPGTIGGTYGGNPVACAEGNVGAPCDGVGDDRACDSSPGANDGFCDACNITGGESTENEMFILIGSYYIGNPASEAESSAATPALRFELRSDSTEVALPASMGCGSSAGAHAEHAQHQ